MKLKELNFFKKININFLFLIFTYILSSIVTIYFYDATKSLDYVYYRQNFLYFLNLSDRLFDGQSSLYYFLLSKYIYYTQANLFFSNFELVLSLKILSFNNLIYGFGLLGFYKLLNYYRIEKSIIFTTLSLLNFLPAILYLRMTLKVEIIAFMIFGWMIYFLEIYIKKNNYIFLLLSSVSIALISTLKLSISGMTLIFLLFFIILKKVKFAKLKIIIVYSIVFTSLLLIENYQISGYLINEKIRTETSDFYNWNFKAPLNFFTTVNFKDLILNPYPHMHKNSFIGIVLLDTFGDYFNFFWNHFEPRNILSFNKINMTDNFFLKNYLRTYLSLLLSFIYFFLILFYTFKKNNYLIFIISPIFGYIILILSSIGFPVNNFNPNTGDTFKTHYIAFLISISFIFICVSFLQKNRTLKSFFYLLLIIFIIGFPKHDNQQIRDNLVSRYNQSEICNLSLINKQSCNNFFVSICKNYNLNDNIYTNDFQKSYQIYYFELYEDNFVRNIEDCRLKFLDSKVILTSKSAIFDLKINLLLILIFVFGIVKTSYDYKKYD